MSEANEAVLRIRAAELEEHLEALRDLEADGGQEPGAFERSID